VPIVDIVAVSMLCAMPVYAASRLSQDPTGVRATAGAGAAAAARQ